jgi:hypothetical protein
MTDDSTPRWRLVRDSVMGAGNTVFLKGHVFTGDPTALRARIYDCEPLNAAARSWSPTSDVVPRPMWRAAKRLLAEGRLQHENERWFSDAWPRSPDWIPANPQAEEVLAYQSQHEGKSLPDPAWLDGRLNDLERQEAARDAERRRPARNLWVDDRPQWPFGNPMPANAKGFRPRDER